MNKCFSFFFVCFWFTSRSLKWSFFLLFFPVLYLLRRMQFLSFHATIPESSPLDTEYRFQILFVSVFDNRSRFFNILIRFCKGSVQFSSVTQSCTTLCNPMNHSTPGFPVHHQLLEFTQTHVHRVSDAIQPSHPLLSPFPPAPNTSQHQGLFLWVSSSHEVAKVLEFQLQHQSFQWIPRTDLL